jgi:hypothetical protein
MGKLGIIFIVLTHAIFASESTVSNNSLEVNCLHCHQEQQIPSNLIAKRYLMQYSTDKRIEEAMFKYLKDPKKEYSIMPAPFFSKFPMKEKSLLDDVSLKQNIKVFFEKYNMKRKLVLEK